MSLSAESMSNCMEGLLVLLFRTDKGDRGLGKIISDWTLKPAAERSALSADFLPKYMKALSKKEKIRTQDLTTIRKCFL